MRRLISLVVALLLLIGCAPLAAFTSGDFAFSADMDVADISGRLLPEAEFFMAGWSQAVGAISDLAVDLDGDGVLERLVVYSVPREMAPDFDGILLFPGGALHALGLAIYKPQGAGWVKVVDEIVSFPYDTLGCNIEVLILEREPLPYIYVRTENLVSDSFYRYDFVLKYVDGQLEVTLALHDPGYTDGGAALFQINETDMSKVLDSNFYETGTVIYEADYDTFDGILFERAHQRELAPFGIDVADATRSDMYTQLCWIIVAPYDEDYNLAMIYDYTGIPRPQAKAIDFPDVFGASTVTATGNVNVRAEPNLDGRSIGTMQKGDTADYLGEHSIDDRDVIWYKIAFKSGSGWVSSRYSELN